MLERNWKTASELGIKESTRDHLVEVLNRMERGEINERNFHMGTFGQIDIEGRTIEPCCIGGHMRIVAQSLDRRTWGMNELCVEGWLGASDYNRLHDLFYPASPNGTPYSHSEHKRLMEQLSQSGVFLDEARECIDHFLRTGKIDWLRAINTVRPATARIPRSNPFSLSMLLPFSHRHVFIDNRGAIRELENVS